MPSFSDSIIEEFRANGGRVTRPYPDSTLVLVTLRGARSGREMTLPIEYLADGDRLVVFGTKSGAPDNPAWVYNLRANPEVTVEYGGERFASRRRARSPAPSATGCGSSWWRPSRVSPSTPTRPTVCFRRSR